MAKILYISGHRVFIFQAAGFLYFKLQGFYISGHRVFIFQAAGFLYYTWKGVPIPTLPLV